MVPMKVKYIIFLRAKIQRLRIYPQFTLSGKFSKIEILIKKFVLKEVFD